MEKFLVLDENEWSALARTLEKLSPQTLVDLGVAKDWDEGVSTAAQILTIYMQLSGTLEGVNGRCSVCSRYPDGSG